MNFIMAKFQLLLLLYFTSTVISRDLNYEHDKKLNSWTYTEQVFTEKQNGQKFNLVQIVRNYLTQYPDVKDVAYRMMENLQDATDQGPPAADLELVVCPHANPDLCAGVPRVSLPDMWSRVVSQLLTDPDDCQPCIETWEGLQAAACNGLTWEMVEAILIPACKASFTLGGRDPVMCDIISLQGPHIYCILMESTPREICESGNNCYPPDNRIRPPVSERMPWTVKQKLLENGHHFGKSQKPYRKPKRENLLMVAQLSDIHVQPLHSVGSPYIDCGSNVCCMKTSLGTGEARTYGEYNCNLPPRTVELFLERVKETEPDFVIYAGDSPPHTQWDETEESQLNCSQIITDAMSRKFGSDMRVYTNIGNHETYPTNLYSLRMNETVRMNARFVEMWHKLAGFDETANNTMSHMAYYTTTAPGHDKLRILSINTNYDWYTMNFYSTLNQYSQENEEHKTWITTTLTNARTEGERVLVLSHHPVGDIVRSSRWWEEVANNFSDVITLHVSGHSHREEMRLSFDPHTMDAMSVNFAAASTTSNTNVNPSMRVLYLDPQNDYKLVDMETFYLDIKIQDQSIGVPPAIAFSYGAKDLYGLPDMSPNTWRDLVLRFLDDDNLFQSYYRNIRSNSTPAAICNHACKVNLICNMWFPEVSEADECKLLAPPGSFIRDFVPERVPEPAVMSASFMSSNLVLIGALIVFRFVLKI